MTSDTFGARLASRIGEKGTAVAVGLDPNPELIPKQFIGEGRPTASGVTEFCRAVLNAIRGLVPVVKLQSAYFEMFGAEGIKAMEVIASEATSHGLLVIIDAKRGDIGPTSAAYAQAYLGPNAFLPCDAITVSPYLGWDSIEPFFEVALEQNKGVFVCAQTSNPGARDLQWALVKGKPVYQEVAEYVSQRDSSREPSLGVVVGATFPDTARQLRQLGARSWFLVPGFGAQGGEIEAARQFLRPEGSGALFASSRSVIFPNRENLAAWSEEAVRKAAETSIRAFQSLR